MKRFLTYWFAAVLVCILMPQNFAAQERGTGKEKKQKAAVKKFIDEKPEKKISQSKEEIELEMLQKPYFTRELILARAEQIRKRFDKEKISASDCFSMSGIFRTCLKQKYIIADTGLDLKFFLQMIEILDALKKNCADMTNLPKAAQPKLKQQRKALLKKLSALIAHPIDAPEAQVKAQQKAKKARIKELQKIIARQKEEAKRRARQSAGQ